MKRQLAKWIPGTLAVLALAAFITWLIADTSRSAPPSIAAATSRPDLAAFDAPAPPTGKPVVATTDNTPLFEEGMKYYRVRDYSRASFALQQATSQQPDNPEIRFFLGISYLLTDDTRAGIRELKVAQGLSSSPYVEQIHFYLAKALLRQKDTTNAMRELSALVDSGGNLAATAKKLRLAIAENASE